MPIPIEKVTEDTYYVPILRAADRASAKPDGRTDKQELQSFLAQSRGYGNDSYVIVEGQRYPTPARELTADIYSQIDNLEAGTDVPPLRKDWYGRAQTGVATKFVQMLQRNANIAAGAMGLSTMGATFALCTVLGGAWPLAVIALSGSIAGVTAAGLTMLALN